MSQPERHLHFFTTNRPEGRVQLSWDEHTVDELTEEEARRLVLDVALNQFQPAAWGDRYVASAVTKH